MLTMEELKKVKEALAAGKKHISGWSKEMNNQLEAGISEEVRVCKAFEENDSFVETWRFLDKNGYTGRMTAGSCEWFDYICGVGSGYCEPNAPARDDIVYILCDKDGNALMAAGNGCGCDFPTAGKFIEQFCRETISSSQSYEEWKNWLLRFRDPSAPQVLEWLNSEPWNCYDENWVFGRHGILVSRKLLAKKEFLGEKYYLFENTRRHDICGKTWKEYTVAKSEKAEPYETVFYYGYSFDGTDVGDGMSQSEAREMAKSLLVDAFGPLDFRARPRDDDHNRNMVEIADGYACSLPDYDVMDRVVWKLGGTNGAYNRTAAEKAIPELRTWIQENYFLNTKEGVAKLKKRYPGIKLGYPLNVYYRSAS